MLPKYPEDYTGLIENPAYTFLLRTLADTAMIQGVLTAVPASIFVSPGSLLGVCHNENMRSGAKPTQAETNVKEEETT